MPTPLPRARSRDSPAWWALLVALTCSGAAGLTYQVLWLRLLSLTFGVTAYAASTVLAGFMAGLAIGSVAAGRIASRTARPLRLFAAAECGIAATALVSPLLLAALPSWYGTVLAWTGDGAGALTLARFAGAFLILLIPTSLMGATLPLVAASRLVRGDGAASRVSAAYAANTAGAIVGVVLTGVVLIGTIGIASTFWVAAAANLAAAGIAAWLSSGETTAADQVAAAAADDPLVSALPGRAAGDAGAVRRAMLIVLAVSGFASLALEVVWFRILVLFVPATTYAFTAMLAAVLGGIAAGGWLAARLLRTPRDWLRLLARVHGATALIVPGSLALLAWTYGRGWRTSGEIQASVVAILPAAVLMGVAFPVALRVWGRMDESAGGAPGGALARALGSAYAVNVGGAIAGALVGGFVLLPRLGSRIGLVVCAACYLACALLLVRVSARRQHAAAWGGTVVGLFAAAVWLLPDFYTATVARRHNARDRVVWREEGVQTTVGVHFQPGSRLALFMNGLHQANDSPDMLRTHRTIGHLPMALHPRPARALVVGLGGGVTAGAVSQHATSVDIIELSDSVRQGAGYFAHVNYDVLRRPNVRLRVADGRNYLLTTHARYDVLTADIIQPIHAGAGMLYSVEYFSLARRALNDGGLMLQWVGHRPDHQYKLMVRSFMTVFPETTAWAGGTLLVGSTRPLAISRSAFERQRQDPAARVALGAIGLDSFDTLLSWYSAGPVALRTFVGPGDVLSDDRPRLEYHRSLPAERGDVDLTQLRRDLGELRIVD